MQSNGEWGGLIERVLDRGETLEFAVRRFRRMLARQALVREQGHCGRAADLLGIHRNSLTRILADGKVDGFEVRQRIACRPLPGRVPKRMTDGDGRATA